MDSFTMDVPWGERPQIQRLKKELGTLQEELMAAKGDEDRKKLRACEKKLKSQLKRKISNYREGQSVTTADTVETATSLLSTVDSMQQLESMKSELLEVQLFFAGVSEEQKESIQRQIDKVEIHLRTAEQNLQQQNTSPRASLSLSPRHRNEPSGPTTVRLATASPSTLRNSEESGFLSGAAYGTLMTQLRTTKERLVEVLDEREKEHQEQVEAALKAEAEAKVKNMHAEVDEKKAKLAKEVKISPLLSSKDKDESVPESLKKRGGGEEGVWGAACCGPRAKEKSVVLGPESAGKPFWFPRLWPGNKEAAATEPGSRKACTLQ